MSPEFYTDKDLPPVSNPCVAAEARRRIMRRHEEALAKMEPEVDVNDPSPLQDGARNSSVDTSSTSRSIHEQKAPSSSQR